MPLNKKGQKIMRAMQDQYGKKEGERVFYASENKGNIKGVTKMAQGGMMKPQPAPAKKAPAGTMMQKMAAQAKRPYGAKEQRPPAMPTKPMGMAKGGMTAKKPAMAKGGMVKKGYK